uniref:Elongator complex protein 6 n=1 Tax=Rhabditophanes sp. KR3021 TaxID=114890 RepID=A0AC35UF75_9BILA
MMRYLENKLPTRGVGLIHFSHGSMPLFLNLHFLQHSLQMNRVVNWISVTQTEEQFKATAGKYGIRLTPDKANFIAFKDVMENDIVEQLETGNVNQLLSKLKESLKGGPDNQLVIIEDIGTICDLYNLSAVQISFLITKFYLDINPTTTTQLICGISDRIVKAVIAESYDFVITVNEYDNGVDNLVSGTMYIEVPDVDEDKEEYHALSFKVTERNASAFPIAMGAV